MSDNTVAANQFRDLFLTDTPFLDVRAEGEFGKGTFPMAVNIPILNNEERAEVGICYKEEGNEAAVELGHRLVSGDIRDRRVQAWCDFAKGHPGTHIYCWRGGMRSNLARQWIREAGIEVPLIEGGFKALRRLMIETIDQAAAEVPLIRIGGKTGTAKTVLINELAAGVDLEGHANHRGSSFGRRVSGVPTQIDFEHALGIDLLRKRQALPGSTLVVEDESRRIGACAVPQDFFDKMASADVGVIEMPLDFRVQRILNEYVIEMTAEFMAAHPDDGWELFVDYLTQSLVRVRKRLGHENFQNISGLMDAALNKQKSADDTSDHEAWITELLARYYDPMCDYQLGKQEGKIAFRGSYDEVLAWADERSRVS
jgi:tRNA 2-selenouridine synthase